MQADTALNVVLNAPLLQMDIGNFRLSPCEQNLDLQLDAFGEVGCEQIFTDQVSGAKSERAGPIRNLLR